MDTTTVNLAHTLSRLVDVPVSTFDDIDLNGLLVLYYGVLSDGAPASFRSTVDYLATDALELYAGRAHHTPAERAYCHLVLARRARCS